LSFQEIFASALEVELNYLVKKVAEKLTGEVQG